MMNLKYLCSAALVVGISGPALAESLDRNELPLEMLFENGNAVRFSFTYTSPDASAAPVGGTGSVLNSYFTAGFAYKREINDRMDLGLFINQPYGADSGYTGGFLDGFQIDAQSNEIAAVLKYGFENNVSVYGGLRIVQSEFNLDLPAVFVPPSGYSLESGKDVGYGFLVGAAIEFPERAARIGLTYSSKVKHEFDSTEFGTMAFGKSEAELPQSVKLDARVALNSKTLLFGGIKWSDYSEFDVFAPGYAALVTPGSVIDYQEDSIDAFVGLGRKINDEWSVFGVASWTKKDDRQSSLRPYNGKVALALGAVYETGQFKITGGVQYEEYGDATTLLASYSGSNSINPFIQIGYSF
jgi:long-subunit fatty acid transport protein